jgi:hypothetical protein
MTVGSILAVAIFCLFDQPCSPLVSGPDSELYYQAYCPIGGEHALLSMRAWEMYKSRRQAVHDEELTNYTFTIYKFDDSYVVNIGYVGEIYPPDSLRFRTMQVRCDLDTFECTELPSD